MNESNYPEEQVEQPLQRDERKILPIIALGGAIAAAILLTRRGGGFVLTGESTCSIADPVKAQIHLRWTDTHQDVDYDVLVDGHIAVTIKASSGLNWNSNLIDSFGQNRVHKYQVQGVQSKKLSNVLEIKTSSCTGPPAATMLVTGAGVAWL